MTINIQDWIDDNFLDVKWVKDNIFEIENVGKFLVISDKRQVFNDQFNIVLDDDELDLFDEFDNFTFQFGSRWYYFNKEEKTALNPLKHLGLSTLSNDNIPFLGIHGKYELCNGTRDYNDWCKKAKFLGIKSLGICEKQTLAGVYDFNKACKASEIKPILGSQVKLRHDDEDYWLKLYAKNDKGWSNLLHINKTQIVDNLELGSFIDIERLKELSEGIICIIHSETDLGTFDYRILNFFENRLYFQIDTVEWKHSSTDERYLNNIKYYLDNIKDLKPILISDAYYLDKEDYKIKNLINRVGNKLGYERESYDQYFKPIDTQIQQLGQLFKDNDTRFDNLIEDCIGSLIEVEENIEFDLKRTGTHLPKYKMNPDEAEKYETNSDLFYSLIEDEFNNKIAGKVENEEEYLDRIEKEIAVLEEGGVVDYFLILWDISNWCKKNTGVTSIGRGSAGGSLVSHLLGTTNVDPLMYNLIFERFLNKGRLLGGSLPDIDYDIPSGKRQELIEYIINKYGKEQVAFIGVSQNFKLKSTLKDFLGFHGVDFKDRNFFTSLLTKEYDFAKSEGLFEVASFNPSLKAAIKKYPETIELIDLCIFQPRSFGIHAAGIIIVPEEDKEGNKTTVFDYLPIRKTDGNYVTEWEKEAVEGIGLLKEDLLGLTQIDKFIRIHQLIEQGGKEIIQFKDIDLTDKKVYKLFQDGLTEDVFQFNTPGMKQYCEELKPENIEQLIAANSLYRPGAMESNAHHSYAKIKNGEKEAEIPPGLEDILGEYYGLFIYQEGCMLAYQKLTNCDPNEADDFRKVITKTKPGKKNPDVEKYEINFKEGYRKIIDDEEKINEVWDSIINFAKYSFNKAHSAAYSLTGYWAQWLKCYYPTEFYTTALEFASDDNKKTIIQEINHRKLVNLLPPDVNKSHINYSIDYDTNSIYWSLLSIKFVGEKAVNDILKEREENGLFYSFEEFLERIQGTKVNKRVIVNMILTGCFDEIENIVKTSERKRLLDFYFNSISSEITDEIKSLEYEHEWLLLQKQICGYGDLDFKSIFKSNISSFKHAFNFLNPEDITENCMEKRFVIAGFINPDMKKYDTRKGPMLKFSLNNNGQDIPCVLWPTETIRIGSVIESSINKIALFSGICKKDSFKNKDTFYSFDKSELLIV